MNKKIDRIVVKVGTSTVTDANGKLDRKKIRSIAEQISNLKERSTEVILVTSGSVAAGIQDLGWLERPNAIKKLQAAASIGQSLLMQAYNDIFSKHKISVGQILITQQDLILRQQYLNIQNTIETLLDLGAVPIINENDSTSVEELKFGDNDTLAALVTNLTKADLLVILSNIDGMFDKDPAKHADTKLISDIKEITPEVEMGAGGVGTKFGSGGMATKVRAAKITAAAGTPTIVANGSRKNVLIDIAEGISVGTKFHAPKKKLGQRKLWIAYAAAPRGSVFIDGGARTALMEKGHSLLPAGVVDIEGEFSVGDILNIYTFRDDGINTAAVNKSDANSGRSKAGINKVATNAGATSSGQSELLARGISNFTSEELSKIKGLKTKDAKKILKNLIFEEVVHRDCLVLL